MSVGGKTKGNKEVTDQNTPCCEVSLGKNFRSPHPVLGTSFVETHDSSVERF